MLILVPVLYFSSFISSIYYIYSGKLSFSQVSNWLFLFAVLCQIVLLGSQTIDFKLRNIETSLFVASMLLSIFAYIFIRQNIKNLYCFFISPVGFILTVPLLMIGIEDGGSAYNNRILIIHVLLNILSHTTLLISSISGACLGFLWWNTNPAKIILGDVGSHFIGALFPLILISLGAEGLILFFCFLFLMEEASVIIQVSSFKYRKKRVFKMAPIHHHFEMLNWAETTIIVRFWIINGIFVVLGLGLFYADWVLFGS